MFDVGGGHSFSEYSAGNELFDILFGNDFKSSLDYDDHVLAVRNVTQIVRFPDRTLELPSENDVFD